MCADWNELFLDPTKIIRDPDPLVQQFCDLVRPKSKIFDLGCGAGRHLIYLARRGFIVFGGDIAPVGLTQSRLWLNLEGLNAELTRFSMMALPYSQNCFDGIISIGVLNHATLAETTLAIAEAHRILKDKGPFFFILIGRKDARCGDGDEIEPFTFIVRHGIEAGVPHHYYVPEEIERMVSPFSKFEIEERRKPYNDEDPVFGNDARIRARKDPIFQHWVVRCWK
ncbi:MAG: class I SAM-dependent methyltransferase [bacterium]|nr:class I SAM-dependent methyltransferase [bacterium]